MSAPGQEFTMSQPAARTQNGNYKKAGQNAIVMGFGIVFIGTLIQTIGTITRGWIVTESDLRYGLFNLEYSANGSLMSVRVFAILGIILGVATIVMCAIYLKFSDMQVRRKIATLILVSGIGAGGAGLIGALIFALEFYFQTTKVTDKNYSFALCIVGGILIITGGIVAFLGARQHYRASYFARRNFIIQHLIGRNPSQQSIHSLQDYNNVDIWHTQQLYNEPPPSYHQLQLSAPPLPKQEPQEVAYDTLPPSYAEAVKWCTDT